MRVIPKKAHLIWYQGWSQLPSKYISNIKSVIDKNPGYEIYKWDNDSMRTLIKSIGQEYLDKYDSFKIMHQRIDFGRVAILYAAGGGISVDTDAVAHNGFDSLPFINTSDFIVSRNSSNEIENLVKAGIPEVLINATILVSPKHYILKNYLDYMMGLNCSTTESSYSCLQGTTGPKSFTKYLLDNYKDQITILNNEFLDPCNGNDESCTINLSRTVLDQNQEGSWANPNYKKIARAWYFIKRRWMSVVMVLAIIIIFIILSSKK